MVGQQYVNNPEVSNTYWQVKQLSNSYSVYIFESKTRHEYDTAEHISNIDLIS